MDTFVAFSLFTAVYPITSALSLNAVCAVVFLSDMCCSFLIRFRHFFSLENSFGSDSFLFFLFRFIGVKGRYHVLLLGCVSLNGGDTKPLIITVLAL